MEGLLEILAAVVAGLVVWYTAICIDDWMERRERRDREN
jgi:hypothetical protein